MVNTGNVETLIPGHLERRPMMRAVDVYKMLYQGVYGVGHLLIDDALNRLLSEAQHLNLDEQLCEPLIDEVSIDGSWVRVNLRPYIRRGLPLETLFSAMKASTIDTNGGEFHELWRNFKEMVRSGKLMFDEDEIEELDKVLVGSHTPPRHHSEVYRKTYAPAYRVVKRSELDKIFAPESLKGW